MVLQVDESGAFFIVSKHQSYQAFLEPELSFERTVQGPF